MSIFRNWFRAGPKEDKPDIGALQSTGDIDGLCRVLQNAPEPRLRKQAAMALKESDDAAAVPSLIEATRDEDWEVGIVNLSQ